MSLMNGAAKAPVCSHKLSSFCLSWLRFSHQFFSTKVLLLQQQQLGSLSNFTPSSRQFLLFFFSPCVCDYRAVFQKTSLEFIQDPNVSEICLGHLTHTSPNNKPQLLVAGAEEKVGQVKEMKLKASFPHFHKRS